MNLLEQLLHEQYDSNGRPVLFECRECGYRSQSLGSVHGHIESHRGYTRFGIQVPFTKTSMANVDELMKRTKVLRVTDTEEIDLESVDGLTCMSHDYVVTGMARARGHMCHYTVKCSKCGDVESGIPSENHNVRGARFK